MMRRSTMRAWLLLSCCSPSRALDARASRALMERLAPRLRSHWSRAAAHLPAAAPEVASLSLAHFDDHVDAGGFLGASRSAPSADSGWAVGGYRAADGLARALDDGGTLVLNGASDTVPALASLALASLDALALPSTINGYATRAGEPVAAPPHTDFQEVVCLQCTGRQRWRAWRPPNPLGDALGAALALGKGPEPLRPDALGAPALDVVVEPGDAVYVPAGWPHATDTLLLGADLPSPGPATCPDGHPSLHLTLGLDHAVFSLDAFSARSALRGASDAVLADAAVALPFDALTDVRACAAALGGGDRAAEVADGFAAHAAAIVALQRDLLADAVGDASPAAWARRWRRWARDSTREVLAHNAFIATGAREAPGFMDDAAFDAYVDRAFEVQGVVI